MFALLTPKAMNCRRYASDLLLFNGRLKVGMYMWEQYHMFWQAVMDQLQNRRWQELTAHGFRQYFGEQWTDEKNMAPETMFKFYEWFLWDYRPYQGGQVFADLVGRIKEELPIESLEYWGTVPIQVVQIKEIYQREGHVWLVNLLDGREFPAAIWAKDLEPGDIFMGRWLPVRVDLYIPTPSLAVIPDEVYLYLQKRIESAWHVHPGSLKSFLRDFGCRFEVWLREIAGRDWMIDSLLFEVHGFGSALRQLRYMDGLEMRPRSVVPLFGPLVFDWHLDTSLILLLDEEELLVAGPPGCDLQSAKLILVYALEQHVDLIEENESASADDPIDIDDGRFSWPREKDRLVAEMLVSGMESYRTKQVKSAVRMWYDFTCREEPRFRKPEVWAAAVELAVRQIDAFQPQRDQLESKYGVAASTIGQRYQALKRSLNLVMGDHRYSSL